MCSHRSIHPSPIVLSLNSTKATTHRRRASTHTQPAPSQSSESSSSFHFASGIAQSEFSLAASKQVGCLVFGQHFIVRNMDQVHHHHPSSHIISTFLRSVYWIHKFATLSVYRTTQTPPPPRLNIFVKYLSISKIPRDCHSCYMHTPSSSHSLAWLVRGSKCRRHTLLRWDEMGL